MKHIWNPGKKRPRVDIKTGIVFSKPENHEPLEMTIMQGFPGGPRNPGKVKQPCILWISGAVWMGGKKDFYYNVLTSWVDLARAGYTVAACMYRTRDEARFPAQAQDVATAVRFLRANAEKFSIDPDHIGVFGLSAGGHLTALTAQNTGLFDTEEYSEYSSKVQAAVDHYGPADINTLFASNLEILKKPGGHPFFKKPEQIPCVELLGYRPDENSAGAAAASPVTYAGEKTCPIQIWHGDADPVVPVEQSRELYEVLEKAGCTAEYYEIPGAGHATEEFFQKETLEKIIAFFDTYLK